MSDDGTPGPDVPLEDRLRDALVGRADEVGHPGADERALARRARARARARARRRVAWAGVAATVVLGGAVWRVAEQPGPAHDVRTGPPPAREEPASTCDRPPSTADALVLLDLPGFGLHESAYGSDGRGGSVGPTSVSLYANPAGRLTSGLVVTVDQRTEATTAGTTVQLATGRDVTLSGQPNGDVVSWALPDGAAVTVDGVLLAPEAVLAAAADVDRALTAAPAAPVVLATPPEGLVLVDAAGAPPAAPTWSTTWTDGVSASVRVAATTDPGTTAALEVLAAWQGLEASWIEVAGEPAVLIDRGERFEILWRRADGWSVRVEAHLPGERAPEVAAALCGLTQDDWPAVERRAAEEGAAWAVPPETVMATTTTSEPG